MNSELYTCLEEEEINSIFSNWLNLLSKEEKDSLTLYSTNHGHKTINNSIKSNLRDPDAENIKNAIDRFNLPKDIPVFRAEYRTDIDLEDALDLLNSKFIKAIIIPYYNFISTSFTEYKAWNYMENNLIKPNLGSIYIFMRVIVPQGVKCGYISPSISHFGDTEAEILLTKNLVFKFKEIHEKDGNIILIDGFYHDFKTDTGKYLLEKGVMI